MRREAAAGPIDRRKLENRVESLVTQPRIRTSANPLLPVPPDSVNTYRGSELAEYVRVVRSRRSIRGGGGSQPDSNGIFRSVSKFSCRRRSSTHANGE